MKVVLEVNGERREVEAPGLRRLLDVIREDIGLTGTKEGCGEGECGACTVIMNGETVCSCLVPAAQADGAVVLTVEGLARAGYGDLIDCLADAGAAQCGICTPGMAVTAADFLERLGRLPGALGRDDMRLAIAGNLCRCTGYQKIIDGLAAAAAKRSAGRELA